MALVETRFPLGKELGGRLNFHGVQLNTLLKQDKHISGIKVGTNKILNIYCRSVHSRLLSHSTSFRNVLSPLILYFVRFHRVCAKN